MTIPTITTTSSTINEMKDNEMPSESATAATGSNTTTTTTTTIAPKKNPINITGVFKNVSQAATEAKKKTVAAVSKGTSNITNVINSKTATTLSKKRLSFDGSSQSTTASAAAAASPKPVRILKNHQSSDMLSTSTTASSSIHNRTTSLPNNVYSPVTKRDRNEIDSSSIHGNKPKQFARTMPKEQQPVLSKQYSLHFLTDDAMVVVITVSIVALYPTLINWYQIIHTNTIPFSVLVSWLSVTFAIGYAFGISIGKDEPLPGATSFATVSAVVGRSFRYVKASSDNTNPTKSSKLSKHFKSFPSILGSSTVKSEQQRSWTNLATASNSNNHTNNNNNNIINGYLWRKRNIWETDVDPTLDRKRPNIFNHLMHFKLKKTNRTQMITRVSSVRDVSYIHDNDNDDTKSVITSTTATTGTGIGKFTPNDTKATSFDNNNNINEFSLIDPVCILRGMDIFLTDDPEIEIGSHPWLIDNGLRNVPTIILNFYTQWGNMIFYYELPNYIQDDWDLIQEDTSSTDPDDVKALKRFLLGDDEYRNLRMKIMPNLVDAPYAVKMFAPAKGTQLTIKSDNVNVTWKKYNKGICPRSGKILSIAIEGVVDLVENRFVRSAASLFKGNLQRLLIDCAIIISTPENQQTNNKNENEEEPMACLGFFRLNRVCVTDCPQMPDRYTEEADSIKVSTSLIRASTIMGLSREEISKLTEEIVV